MPAKVMFADGSKADAHNLDDLRERWLLRRSEETAVTHEALPSLETREYSLPSTHDDAVAEYARGLTVLQSVRDQLRLLDNNKFQMPLHVFVVKRATLVAEMSYRQTFVAIVKSIRQRFYIQWEAEKENIGRQDSKKLRKGLKAAVYLIEHLEADLVSRGGNPSESIDKYQAQLDRLRSLIAHTNPIIPRELDKE